MSTDLPVVRYYSLANGKLKNGQSQWLILIKRASTVKQSPDQRCQMALQKTASSDPGCLTTF